MLTLRTVNRVNLLTNAREMFPMQKSQFLSTGLVSWCSSGLDLVTIADFSPAPICNLAMFVNVLISFRTKMKTRTMMLPRRTSCKCGHCEYMLTQILGGVGEFLR